MSLKSDSREVTWASFIAVVVAFVMGFGLGTAGGIAAPEPQKKFNVLYFTPEKTSELTWVKASSYTMQNGCASFDNGSTICHILGISAEELK